MDGKADPLDARKPVATTAGSTLATHLARRLVQIGVTDVFSVPGDFNLTLLDYLIAEPGLTNIGCCNELNAGYAADGYARSRGVGACVVTFTVGGLSVLNAIAGAYSENLPVICIVGGPNSNDYGSNRVLHHTIGLPDFGQELRCFQTVTCYQAVINNLEDAHEKIDKAISTALKENKPVVSNPVGLEVAVEAAIEFLNKPLKENVPLRALVMESWKLPGNGTRYISTMIRCGQNSIIFLINNGGYSTEVEIHDGPYNVIKNWNYTALVDAIHNGEGKCWTTKVVEEEKLIKAIEMATGEKKECLCFIEVVVHKDDTSKELLQWGSKLSSANSRPPNPH